MKRLFSEDDCQAAQVTYLTGRRETRRDVVFFAVPNDAVGRVLGALARVVGRKMAGMVWGTIKKLQTLGLVAGSPDLVILCGGGRTLLVENKVKGNYQSAKQEAFGDHAKTLGHEYHLIIAETPGDAVNQLEALLARRA